MSTENEKLQIIYSMDRDLLFFSTDEHIHLGIVEKTTQHQLEKLTKRVLQHIQQIRKYEQQKATSTDLYPSTFGSRHSLAYQQQTLIRDFFQQKHTQQLYLKLKDIKNQYHEIIRHQQIRILENDMERYEQLQKIHDLSSRLDVYDQVYNELHHLRRALSSIRRNWKLDRIQHIVNTIVALPSSSSSSSSSSATTTTATPISSQSQQPRKTSDYLTSGKILFGVLKRWSRYASSGVKKSSENNYNGTALKDYNQQHQYQHPHILCTNKEQGRHFIMQIIQDFQHVFDENVRQNEQRMYQLYARVFQQNVDPMLAHDIQHLYLSASATSPPSLTSLTPSGLSSVCSWTSDTTRALFFNTHHQGPVDFDEMIHYTGKTQHQSSSPLSLTTKPTSPSKRRKNGIKWIDNIWVKRKQHQQQPDYPITSCQQYYFQQLQQPKSNSDRTLSPQQQQMWSVCLGLLSEHLLYVGQQYYTQWIHEISQCQMKQIAPFQLATETMASTYRALQIEHGYSILSRLCLQMESIGF